MIFSFNRDFGGDDNLTKLFLKKMGASTTNSLRYFKHGLFFGLLEIYGLSFWGGVNFTGVFFAWEALLLIAFDEVSELENSQCWVDSL